MQMSFFSKTGILQEILFSALFCTNRTRNILMEDMRARSRFGNSEKIFLHPSFY